MGMDAYAIDAAGKRLAYTGGGVELRKLIDARQQRAFAMASGDVSRKLRWVDADLKVGELCISANASAVMHVLCSHGGIMHDDKFAPEAVARSAMLQRKGIAGLPMPDYVEQDIDALVHARAFILACAECELGVEISP
jgi:hypothetical protein